MKNLVINLILALFALPVFAQTSPSQKQVVDFKKATVSLIIEKDSKLISGAITYELDILENTDSIFVDAKNLVSHDVALNNAKALTNYNNKTIVIRNSFKKGSKHKMTIEFITAPTSALYHIDTNNDGAWDQLWTQGQGKYTSNWLPSLDDMNDKMIWDITIHAPSDFEVITNGTLVMVETVKDKKRWVHTMDKPMSSYLVAVVVGAFAKAEKQSKNGTPIHLYYYPQDVDKVAATYQHTVAVFDFFEREIGIPYPWKTYAQVPVKDFLYSGMENTTATIFNDEFVTDAIGATDKPYLKVNAHELAHQWFGNLVTEQESTDHWLHEGFATYYALLAEESIYGSDYFYMQLYQNAESLYEQAQAGNGTAVLDPKASSLTFYEHGAWALHALREQIGTANFKKTIKTYLSQFAYKNVSTTDFLTVASSISGENLDDYKAIWLTNTQFPLAESLTLLRKSPFMENYLQLAARRTASFNDAYNSYKEVLDAGTNRYLMQEMVTQLNLHDDPRAYDLLKKAAATNDVYVRQTIALSTVKVTTGNKQLIESLLNDASYLTREQSLFLLWNAYPANRKSIIDTATANWQSLNASLDMALQALMLNTQGYTNAQLIASMQKLQAYSNPTYSISDRTAAFDYLINLGIMNEENYRHLLQASLHHNWRFYSNSRELLKAQYKNPEEQKLIDSAIKKQTPENSKRINTILGIS